MGIMIFMLLSPILATIEVLKGKFEHVVHEILPRTCAWIGFKFYNKQTVEAVIKNWEGFTKVLTYVAYEMKHLRTSSIDKRRIHLDFESNWW